MGEPSTRTAGALSPSLHRGNVVLITGGGTGIGRATALEFARCGADIVVAGRRAEPLKDTVAEIEAMGARALAVPTDIRDEEQVAEMVTQTLGRFGRIDVLVNNAGGQFSAPAEDISLKGFRAVHRLAVDGSWAVTREVAVRAMIPQRSGVIFFMAFSPRRGIASFVHATSARAALENLASGLSLEWSKYRIRTICIAPGTIATAGMDANYAEDARAQWAAAVPLGRLGTAEDISPTIAFLASPAASYLTGTTVVIDGGADAWGNAQPAPQLKDDE
ncbi:SDR family oxidoreductase [Mycolicibacterium mageritense]|uniref:SDR family oxidoreductase n=1 Tax=Mycolicibacterium mageritense TaxID=53462 RepID=UPI001E2EE4E2|nr:SDR family oxidoreductase [Mycolicibacterium mageritense]